MIKSFSMSANTWTHLALVNNAGSAVAYKNGIAVATDTLTEDVSLGVDYSIAIGIANYDKSTIPFEGYVDNIRVTKGTALWTTDFNLNDAELFYAHSESYTIPISSADTWESKTWDISGVADADKNAIDQLQMKVLNAGSARDFYIDNVKAQ